jgi:hypothetical protein
MLVTRPTKLKSLRVPASRPADRWQWARDQVRLLGGHRVWIGYNVRSSLSVDFRRLAPPVARLAQPVGRGKGSDALSFLFEFTAEARPVLARVHASRFLRPADLGGGVLVWLGAAEDGASLAWLQALFGEAPTVDLKTDLVAAVGLHSSSAAVVPILLRWWRGAEPPSVRAQAAEWLRHHARAAREAARLIAQDHRNVVGQREAIEPLLQRTGRQS